MRFPSFPEYFSKPRSRRTFLGYFLSITTLCGLAVIVSTVLSYAAFEREIVTQLNRQNRIELERVGSVFTASHAAVVPNALQLLANPTINRLLYARSIQQLDVARANAILDQAKLGNPYIQSLVVYSYSRQTFYSTEHGPVRADEYSDTSLLEVLSTTDQSGMYQFVPRHVHGEPVLSVLVGFPVAQDGILRGALVTNIAERRLRELIDGGTELNGSVLIITDTDGQVLSHTNAQSFGQYINDSQLWDAVRARVGRDSQPSDRGGTFVMEVNGTETAVSFLVHHPMNWHIILTIPTDELFRSVRSTRNQIVIVTSVSIVAAAMLALLLAMWIYGPFDRLRKVTTQLAFDFLETPPQATDALEIKYLDRVLRQIHQSAARSAQETRELRKRDLLKSLLLGYASDRILQDNTGAYALQPDGGLLRVIVCRLDNVALLRQEGGEPKIRSKRDDLVRHARTLSRSTALVEMAEDHIVLISPCPAVEPDTPDYLDSLLQDLGLMGQSVRGQTSQSVTSGVSRAVSHVRELHEAYMEALRATDYRFRLGQGRVILAESLDISTETTKADIPEQKVRALIHAARGGDSRVAIDILRTTVSEFRNYSYSDFTFAAQHILYEIEHAFRSVGGEFTRVASNLHRHRLDTEWLETVDGFLTKTEVFIRKLAETALHESGKKTRALIDQARTIIELSFTDPNLSAKQIAAQLGVSTNYLRQSFREVEGRSINEDITAERLRHVAHTLEKTNEAVRSVQEQSGFSNYTYFFRKFREHFGMTPTEYRRRSKAGFSEFS